MPSTSRTLRTPLASRDNHTWSQRIQWESCQPRIRTCLHRGAASHMSIQAFTAHLARAVFAYAHADVRVQRHGPTDCHWSEHVVGSAYACVRARARARARGTSLDTSPAPVARCLPRVLCSSSTHPAHGNLRSCQTRSRPAAPRGVVAAIGSSAATSESETFMLESASAGNANAESQPLGPSLSHGPSLPASLTLSPKSVTSCIETKRGGAPALHRDGTCSNFGAVQLACGRGPFTG